MNLLSVALFAFCFTHLSIADTEGSIQLYSDGDCTSPRGEPISTLHDLCMETNQALSISEASLPSCPSGQPVLYISDEENCNRPSIQPAVQSGNIGDCLSLPTGSGIGSAAFVCIDKVTTVSDPQPGASTTLKSAFSTSATDATESSLTITTPTSATSPAQSAGKTTPGFSGLPLSDRIALGCALGLGLPALVFTILTWYNAWD